MRKMLICTMMAVVLGLNGLALADQAATEKLAIKIAEGWLKLVDQGQYASSWDQAASNFKAVVPKDTWLKTIKGVREPLGKVISREIEAQRYLESIPGSPDGQYVVIKYKTTFENKKEAAETITPMLDNGDWRVAGYYIY